MERKLRSICLHNTSGGLSAKILYENFKDDEYLGSDSIWIHPDTSDTIATDEKIKEICNKFWELYQ